MLVVLGDTQCVTLHSINYTERSLDCIMAAKAHYIGKDAGLKRLHLN